MDLHWLRDPGPGRQIAAVTARGNGPRRRASDHVHPEYWEEGEQHRYEARISEELKGIRTELKAVGDRILMVMGAVALLAFILPIVAPFIRSLFNIP